MEVTNQSEKWLQGILHAMGCTSMSELTVNKCKAPVKDTIGPSLYGALSYVNRLNETIREINDKMTVMQGKLVQSQESVIHLQQLLECKDEQLIAVTSSVKSSVQETVKEEFKTYSSAVMSGHQEQSNVTPANIASVVKKVVEEEDRSRNIMVFGLVEEENEVLSDKVSEVMETIGEKPKMEVCRQGKPTTNRPRPVKIAFSNSLFVVQILSKAQRLKSSVRHSLVFLSPDRSVEQRAEHRSLVADLKKRKLEEPDKRHYIRNGTVKSAEKT